MLQLTKNSKNSTEDAFGTVCLKTLYACYYAVPLVYIVLLLEKENIN